jgi:hypothetical protein
MRSGDGYLGTREVNVSPPINWHAGRSGQTSRFEMTHSPPRLLATVVHRANTQPPRSECQRKISTLLPLAASLPPSRPCERCTPSYTGQRATLGHLDPVPTPLMGFVQLTLMRANGVKPTGRPHIRCRNRQLASTNVEWKLTGVPTLS